MFIVGGKGICLDRFLPFIYCSPDIQDRLENTESGQAVAAQIHAYTTLLNLVSSSFFELDLR